MKIILFILCLLMSLPSFAGLNLKCDADITDDGLPSGLTVVIKGGQALECRDKKGNTYQVEFDGWGLGLELTGDGVLSINCPFVNKKKILGGRELHVFGPRVIAGIVGGAQLGIGANIRGALCTIAGVNRTLGASVLGGRLSILHYGDVH